MLTNHSPLNNFGEANNKPKDINGKTNRTTSRGLKSCLFTGFELGEIPNEIINLLDYIKTGPYIKELGGLKEPSTNQKFIKLREIRS